MDTIARNDPRKEETSSSEIWKSISGDSSDTRSNGWDCNICLEFVQEPVVTFCGHLYCWPCIYKWLHLRPISDECSDQEHRRRDCPVCKAEVSRTTLVPLYGRGGGPAKPPAAKPRRLGLAVPPRPTRHACGACSSSSRRTPTPRVEGRHYPNRSGGADSSSPAAAANLHQFGEVMYARMFGNVSPGVYPHPDSYHLVGSGNPRLRRQLAQADRSLGRIYFFLCCSVLLCLILF